MKAEKLRTAQAREIPTPKVGHREALIKGSGPLIRLAVEKGITTTPIEQPDDFNQEFIRAMSETDENGKRKYNVFVVSRHESHPDGFIIARLALDLTVKANSILPPNQQISGFFMPLAQSLENGQQDKPMMRVYHEIKPTLRKFTLIPAPIVREKDRKLYQTETDPEQDARIRALISEGYSGVVLFPEGTTTAGKTDENGQLNGMVPFERNSIKRSYLFLKRQTGRESLVIPAATFGGRQILNPDNKWVSPSLLFSALISPHPVISRIRIGMPIRSDGEPMASLLRGRDRDALNRFLGRKIAGLIPPEERGVYA